MLFAKPLHLMVEEDQLSEVKRLYSAKWSEKLVMIGEQVWIWKEAVFANFKL
jgi:hypothetical protein